MPICELALLVSTNGPPLGANINATCDADFFAELVRI